MGFLRTYMQGLRAIHTTGEAVEETSYYGQLEKLLDGVGSQLSPRVTSVLTTKNRGAGIPDGGLFVAREAVKQAGDTALLSRAPERGVIEVKGPAQNVRTVAQTKQVRKYLDRYGKVLVTTYREFLVLKLNDRGEPIERESLLLAKDEHSFWTLNPTKIDQDRGKEFEEFLKRALLGDASLSAPADLAWFLAAYGRTALKRVEDAGEMRTLATLRNALEEELGLRFEGDDGEHFFRSALVQTLFYGVFAAWVFWAEKQPKDSQVRFTWRQAQWTLSVPMVRVLFHQLATPDNLPIGLDEILDWTDDVLARVDRELFFQRFEAAEAVQYFYEPFLEAYDPELRRELGVWYTPPEVVNYMVERVDQALREELAVPLGLADPKVHVLDPCTGTGSFLTKTIMLIARPLEEKSGDGLVAAETKQAVLSRIHGFELLPAPFVIAHLQVGLALQRLGVPLDAKKGERASVYLTNSLTGWVEGDEHPQLPFPEFVHERDAAEAVKRDRPILVVLGNPPYNGFAGVSGRDEGGLVAPYKEGLAVEFDITKNKLDDLYIRFFRVAERRIAEQTGQGIVCFISSFSWLADPSTVVMRRRLLREFDSISIDSLNGDSRETGKKTPGGDSDPSIFSTKLNPAGIQVGTAISLLARRSKHNDEKTVVRYRDFWGSTKRAQLVEAVVRPDSAPEYEPLQPNEDNWYRLRRWSPRPGYAGWPAVNELCAEDPMLGLNENRGFALSDYDRQVLLSRMQTYLDAAIPLSQVDQRLQCKWSGFDPQQVRRELLKDSPFDPELVVRFQPSPFDLRYAYVDATSRLWNRSRPLLVRAAQVASNFLLVRRRSPRSLDGAAFLFSRCLVDQHALHKDAYVIPFWLGTQKADEGYGQVALFQGAEEIVGQEWHPNLSEWSLRYLRELGIDDAETNRESASLIWLHALAIGFTPLYLEENGDAIRSTWPRIPLPRSADALRDSARLGYAISRLLDLDEQLVGVDTSLPERLRQIAAITRADGKTPDPAAGDLAVTAGYGIVQQGREMHCAGRMIQQVRVMPGAGRVVNRERTNADSYGLTGEQRDLLGEQLMDVYLNDHSYWRGVPAAAWDYTVGGFHVLRKWLSHREKRALGRDLTISEARTFTGIVRRLTELVLLGPSLDANYITESPQQEKLFGSASS